MKGGTLLKTFLRKGDFSRTKDSGGDCSNGSYGGLEKATFESLDGHLSEQRQPTDEHGRRRVDMELEVTDGAVLLHFIELLRRWRPSNGRMNREVVGARKVALKTVFAYKVGLDNVRRVDFSKASSTFRTEYGTVGQYATSGVCQL